MTNIINYGLYALILSDDFIINFFPLKEKSKLVKNFAGFKVNNDLVWNATNSDFLK